MARLPECYDCIFVQLLAKGNTVCDRHWPQPAAVVLETRIVRTAVNYLDIDRSPLQMVGALLGHSGRAAKGVRTAGIRPTSAFCHQRKVSERE